MKRIKYIFLFLGVTLIVIGMFLKPLNKTIEKSLDGKWLEISGSLFVIEGNKFSWYKDYNNLKDNYYTGEISYTSLDNYNYDDKYIKEKYGDIDPSLFYILKLYPKRLTINDNKTILKNKYHLSFELALETNKKEGILYSKDLIKTYEIIKYGN